MKYPIVTSNHVVSHLQLYLSESQPNFVFVSSLEHLVPPSFAFEGSVILPILSLSLSLYDRLVSADQILAGHRRNL